MTQPYLGEIRFFAGNFAPRHNAYCAGQLLSIAQNSALFSLLGTYYGGDGVSTFALPDLRGRMPISMGQGPGLSNYVIGEPVGSESVQLLTSNLPSHTHIPIASTSPASTTDPTGQIPATLQAPFQGFYVQDANKTGSPVALASQAIQNQGSNFGHENRMPGIAISIIIALEGIYPSRN